MKRSATKLLNKNTLRMVEVIMIFLISLPVFSSKPQCGYDANNLLLRLQSYLDNDQTLIGQYDTYFCGHNWQIDVGDMMFVKSDMYDVCGDYPAVFGFDMNGIMQTSNKAAAIAHYKRGGIITISNHMNNIETGKNAWDKSSKSVVFKILHEKKYKEAFCKKLDSYASFFLSLNDKNGEMIPVLFRPWHESTSNYYWWGTDCCSDKEFKRLWRFTYDYLVRKKNVTNLVWVYSLDNFVTEDVFNSRYPGDKYVDIIGYEKYHWWTEKETEEECLSRFKKEFRAGLTLLNLICDKHHKVPAVSEIGFAGGVPKNFWTNCVYDIVKDFKSAYILIWSNIYDNVDRIYGPYPGSPDSADFVEFSKMKGVVFLNALNEY